MEGNQASGADERAVHGEVGLHALVGVVAIEEQEVEGLAVQEASDLVENSRGVGVVPYEIEPLPWQREALVQGHPRFVVAAAPRSAGKVNADQVGRWACDPSQGEQGSASSRANFQDTGRAELV